MTAPASHAGGAASAATLAAEILDALPAAPRVTLARCAVVTRFDAAMYDAVLGGTGSSGTEAELQTLLSYGLVAELSGAGHVYLVPDGLHEAAWASWFDGPPGPDSAPPELRRVAGEVARYCAEHGLTVERLRALLIVDPAAARAWLVKEFDECDRRYDLAGCANLLDVLDEPSRLPFVDAELAAERDERRRYLAARDRWRAAFLSSEPSRYLARPALEQSLEALLAEDGPRLLRMYGSGGSGKSTLLRWFLARRCVPGRMPCAHVDLDTVDPVNATRYPWLVILEIAHQLNAQMPGNPFQELLREHDTHRSALTARLPLGTGAGSGTLGAPLADSDGDEIKNRFLDALHDATDRDATDGGAARPVVLVLDTVEEAMLRPAGDAAALLELLGELGTGSPAVRLLVSGRRSAAEEEHAGPSYPARLLVPPFSPAESAEYLRTVRHVDRPDLVDAIVERAGCLPWQLAVWGDVVEQHPNLTSEMLEELQPEVAWAVDRVVGRLPGRLQWLVRYGVVPRRLRRDFAEQVLLPRIARAMADAPEDRPAHDAVPPGAVEVFPTHVQAPPEAADFAELWNQLTRYASTTSWLGLAPGAEDAVVFHAELREPMRRLVAAQPVGDLLHQDAVRHYTELAGRDGERWASWTCEAIYHRFQWAGPAAERHWRDALAEARARGLAAEAVVELAGEVLGPEYLDDHGTPRIHRSGQPLLDLSTVAAAHAERAWGLSRIALRHRLTDGHPTWSLVDASLSAADRLPADPASDSRRQCARAALRVVRARHTEAAELLKPALAGPDLTPVDRCTALVLLAEALRATGRQEAARTALLEAGHVADRLGVPEVAAQVAVALAEGSALLGRVDEADDGLRQLVDRYRMVAQDVELRRTRARIALALGRPAAALALAGRPEAPLFAEQTDAQLLLGDPVAALRGATELLAGALEPERQAEVLTLRADAAAELLDIDRAVGDLERARELYVQLGESEAAGACSGSAASLMLHGVGNLREAQQYLDDADRLSLEPGSVAWTNTHLLRAELCFRRDDQTAASRAALEALDPAAAGTGGPRQIVDVALAAFCWAPDLEAQVTALLEAHLPRIRPAVARLAALTALTRCPRWDWGARLLELTLGGPPGPALLKDATAPEDAAWRDLRVAELLRIAGQPSRAVELLTAAATVLAARYPLAWSNWLRAVQRADPDGRALDRLDQPTEIAGFPLHTAAQALTLATRQLIAGRAGPAQRLLDAAERALSGATPRVTRWHARLAELRGRLAELTGQRGEAGRHALMATALRRELGEPAAEAESLALERPTTTVEWERTVRGTLDRGGDLVIEVGAEHTTLPSAHPLVAGLHAQGRAAGRTGLVRWLRGQLESGGFLELAAVLAQSQVDLRIVAEAPLAQLPWELATVHGRRLGEQPGVRSLSRRPDLELVARTRVRILQQALAAAGRPPGPIDGLHGPQTSRALRIFQNGTGIAEDGIAGPDTWRSLRAAIARPGDDPTVLVVRRSRQVELVAQRGYSLGGGVDLEDAYARLGWRVRSLPSAGLAEQDQVGAVDLLHINASMQVAGAVPYLSFAADPSARSQSESLTCTAVESAVHRLALRGSTPLVLLDVAGTPSFGIESVRQLLLRNDFAHQLLALGQCYAVLATGPAPQPTAAKAQQRLVQAATEAATAGELANALRTVPPGARSEPRDLLSSAATALFTAVPPDLMPPLRWSSARPS